jgi:hypothetical protein
MGIDFNHTLVHAKETWAAARDVGGVLGLAEPSSYGPFAVLQFDNGTTLDFIEDTGEITAQHYAFLVGEDDFDAIWDRLKAAGRQWWADPHKRRPGEINHEDGGRGLYWQARTATGSRSSPARTGAGASCTHRARRERASSGPDPRTSAVSRPAGGRRTR